jgi:hypothetical protein
MAGTERKTYTYTPFTYDNYTESDEVIGAKGNKTNAENAYSGYLNAGYTESDAVKTVGTNKANAESALANYGDFSYSKSDTFNDIMNKILNREKFSYDVNGDALYQQYKDKYIQQGKMAMADTMGQAAAMTGGYGNSYAASVGNQAYQASLQQLNDVIPELYQMAYDRYNQEGQDLYNQYGMLSDDRNTEYGMWGDKRNALVADRDYYANDYNNAYSRDYGQWVDKGNMLATNRDYYANDYNNAFNRDYGMYSSDRTLAHAEHTTSEGYKYQDVADANAFAQWQANYDESQRQYDASLKEQQRQYNETMKYNKQQTKYQASQAAKLAKIEASKPVTMSTDDYSYWSGAFSDVTSKADAEALRDQMVAAVGDSNMAYELYYQWERKNLTGGGRTNTTVYRGANGQIHMLN